MGIGSFLAKQARQPSGWFGRKLAGRLLNKANSTLEDLGLKLLDLNSDSAVLEIGFGNGRLISLMGNHIISGKIVGIEISAEMISSAKKKNQLLISKGKVELIYASLNKIPAANETFDKIFTANTIYFWPDLKTNMQEIRRTLKVGGKFYCAIRIKNEMISNPVIKSNLDTYKNLFSKKSIGEFLKESGFHDVQVHSESGKPFTNVIAVGTKK